MGSSVLLLSAFSAFADVQPASVFTDHLVLQRNASVPVWGTASPGEKVTVFFDKQQRSTTTGQDGKWIIRLGAMKAGGPFAMKITGRNTISFQDVYVGEVWLCSGQSNMDMTVAREDRYWCGVHNEQQEVAAANYPMIRVFDVDFVTSDEPIDRAIGTWETCSPATVGHFSAAAYFFARELYKRYKLPIGLITTAFGASTAEAWASKKTLESDTLFAGLLRKYQQRKAAYDTSLTAISRYKIAYAKWQTDSAAARAAKKDPPRGPRNTNPGRDQHSPCVLYNGMVAPLIPYAIRGAIWYQGESNSPTADIYDRIMAALIDNWRADWGQGNFPFIYVQLANNGKNLDTIPGKGGGTTRVREAQLKNRSVPNTAMVVAIDNADDPANIHPKNKQEIGRRLALDAEALAYGEKITCSGPIYNKMKVEGNAIRLSFTQVDEGLLAKGNDTASLPIPGLAAHSGKLTGFAIAGVDKHFVWADAAIDGGTIIVSSPSVPEPVAVRYGWGDNPLISLYNKAGLPASPFRTDAW